MSTTRPFVGYELFTPGDDPDAFLLVRENFNFGGSAGPNTDFWDEINIAAGSYSPNTTANPYPLVSDLGIAAPPSGNLRVGNYFYKMGILNTSDPFTLQKNFSDLEEIYVRWNEFYSSSFIWPEGQKIVRIGNSSGDGGSNNLEYRSYADGITTNQNVTNNCYYSGVPMWDENTNVGPRTAAGVWHTLQYYWRKSSAPDVVDGRSILLIDAIPIDRDPVKTNTNNTYPYNFFRIGLNNDWYGNGPGNYTTIPQNQSRYIDNVEIYSQLPAGVTLP